MKWLFFFPLLLVAQQIQHKAYVANQSDGTVSVIDVSTETVIATVTVGDAPFGLASSVEETVVYVVNNDSNSVSIIDTASNTVTNTLALGGDPFAVAFSPNGTVSSFGFVAYVPHLSGNVISVIDVASETVVSTISLASNLCWSITFTPDGTEAYIGTLNGRVLVIDVATETVTHTISVGTGSGAVAASPDGTVVYVANSGTNNISVINTSSKAVENTIATATNNPAGVAFSPDGTVAYVTILNVPNNNIVQIIDTASQTITGTITVGTGPFSPAFFDNSIAYVTNFSSGTVSVIDVASETVSNTITVGTNPRHIDFASLFPTLSGNQIQGVCKEDIFFTQKELYNEISWAAVEGASSYVVYRDASLSTVAATGSSTQFIDHSRSPHQTYSYFIAAVDALTGEEALIGSVTVTCP